MLLQTNPYQGKAYAGRYYNESVEGWGQKLVPTGFFEKAWGMGKLAWQDSAGKQLYNWAMMDSWVDDAVAKNPKLAEVLTPEQIAKEYPYTEKPIKTPKTRAEVEMIQDRDIQFRAALKAVSGENQSFAPDWIPSMLGGFGGYMLDPLTWATGIAAFSLAPLIPGVANMMTVANISKLALSRRGAAAAVLAVDGWLQQAMYSTLHAGTSRLAERPYSWGRLVEETLIGGPIGAVLGASFPGIASINGRPIVAIGDAGRFLTNMAWMRRMLNDPRNKNNFWKFLKDESGGIDFSGMAKVLSGRNAKTTKNLEETLKMVEVSKIWATGLDFKGNAVKLSVEDLVSSTLNWNYKFYGMRMTSQGVTSLFGRGFEKPKPFYRADLSAKKVSYPHTARNVPDYMKQFYSLYLAIPAKSIGFREGGVHTSGKPLILTTTPEGAATVNVVKSISHNTAPETVRVVEVGLSVGHKGVRLLDLDHPFLSQMWPTLIATTRAKHHGVRVPEGHLFSTLPEVHRANIKMAALDSNTYDGIIYKDDTGFQTVELKQTSMDKVVGFSDSFLKYEAPTFGKYTIGDISSIRELFEGTHPESAPPAVENLLESYYKGFDAEDDSFFNKHIKRIHPDEINYRPITDRTTRITAGVGKAFNLETDFADLPQAIWQDVKNILSSMLTPDTGFLKKRVANLEGVITDVLGNDIRLVDTFITRMRGAGYRFPVTVDINHSPKKWIILNDRVIHPLGEGNNVVDTLLYGETPWFEGVNLEFPVRSLRLDLAPLNMVDEEIAVLKRVVEDSKGMLPKVDTYKNTTVLSNANNLKEFLSPDKQEVLRNLGFDSVEYQTPEGKYSIALFTPVFRDKIYLEGSKYRDSFFKLSEKPAPEPTTTKAGEAKPAERPDERRTAFLSMLTSMGGAGPTNGVKRMAQTIQELVGSSGQKDKVKKLVNDYLEQVEQVNNADPNSQTYTELVEMKTSTEADIQKIYQVLKLVEVGGLEARYKAVEKVMGNLRWMEGPELLNLITFMPDMPYASLGGDNIQATYNSYNQHLKALLFRRLEKDVGTDGVKLFMKGLLDKDLIAIKQYMVKKLDEQKGKHGTVQEDGKQQLQVSDTSWKVYNILREVMDGSQKLLLSSGFYRSPRDAYLGAIIYDTSTVLKTPRDTFVNDVVDATSLSVEQANDIYSSFAELNRLPSDYEGPLRDLRGFLEKHRKLDFKDVDAEYNFLAKYGKTPLPGTDRGVPEILGKLDVKSGSNIATGVMGSIDSDSKLAAVSHWFGTRPFLTLDLAHSLLTHKHRFKTRQQGASTGLQRRLLAKLARTKSHAEKVLQNLVLGENEAFGNVAQTRKMLRIATNMKLLTFSGIPAFFSDLVTSTAHLSRITGRSYPNQLAQVIHQRFKHMGWEGGVGSKGGEMRRKVARAANVVLAADTREYMARFFGGGDIPGYGTWLESGAMRWTGNPAITDIGRTSNSAILSMYFGEAFKLPWGQLTKFVQDTLQTHRITPDVWEMARHLPDIFDDIDGVTFMFPDRLHAALMEAAERGRLTREMAQDIYQGFSTFLIEVGQTKGVPWASPYEHAFTNVDANNPDSVIHNLFRFAAMYKPIAIAVGRSLVDAGSGKGLGVRNDVFHYRFAKVLAMATTFGAMQVILRDIATGKEPRDMDNVEFWTEAFLKGGVFGLLVDFTLGEHSGYEGGFAGNFLGPVIMGPLYHTQQVVSQLALLEPAKSWNAARKLFKDLVPGISPIVQLLLNTAFLDTLGDLSGSPKQQQAIRKRLAKKGSGYFAD